MNDAVYRQVSRQEYRWRAQREFGAFIGARGYSPEQESALRAALIAYYDAEERAAVGIQLATASPTGDRQQAAAGLARAKQAFFDAVGPVFSDAELVDVSIPSRRLPRPAPYRFNWRSTECRWTESRRCRLRWCWPTPMWGMIA